MHHSCQEDFAQFGTAFHYLQKEKKKKNYEGIYQEDHNIVVTMQM